MTTRSSKRKKVSDDEEDYATTGTASASTLQRRGIRSLTSPEKKRASIISTKSENEIRCESLYQQAMEQVNGDVGKWCQKMLAQLGSSESLEGPPMTLEFQMHEYIRLVRLIQSLYKREHGDVLTFGSDEMLQLGMPRDNECQVTASPRPIKNLRGVIMVAAGGAHNAAVFQNGSVYTWGSNDEGSLGREAATDVDEQVPQIVKGFTPSTHCPASDTFPYTNEDNSIIQVAAGATHTLYLSVTGLVYMSGDVRDEEGKTYRDKRPPDDTTKDIPREANKPEDQDIRGRHFKPNHVYQLTDKAKLVSAGANYSAALLADGETIVTWGIGVSGQMARLTNMTTDLDKDGKPDLKSMLPRKPHAPVEPEGDKDTPENWEQYHQDVIQHKEVDVPNYHKALEVLDKIFLKPHPVQWAGPTVKRTVLDVACGDYHLLVVARNRGSFETTVYTSGHNNYGQLGHGDFERRDVLTPVKALEGKNIVKVAGGHQHSLCLDITSKAIYAFGRSDYGQIGNYDKHPKEGALEWLPVRVAFPENDAPFTFTHISCGDHHNGVLTKRGDLYTWGFGDTSGALGHGSERDELRPRKVNVMRNLPSGETGVVRQVECGGQHTAIILTRFSKES